MCTYKIVMKKQCILSMLALIKAALVHFGARNKMAPSLVCETIGALKEVAYALSFKAMRGTYLVQPLATVRGEPSVLV